MSHRVTVSDLAEDDLVGIVEYIFEREADLEPGLVVHRKIEKAIASLSETPARGRIVPALRRIGIKQFREIIVRPWRVIYRVRGREVRVVAILDGRRGADELLRERAVREIRS